VEITDFSWEFYYPIKGRAELSGTTEKNYSPTGIMSQTDVINTYNSDYLLSTSTTFKSNGDQIIVKNYYPDDYNNISQVIQDMKLRNMVSVLISTETWLKKSNNDEFLIAATINEFIELPNGEIKIKKIYKLECKEPVPQSVIGYQDPTILVRNSTYFKEQLNFNYDASSYLIDVNTTGGEQSCKYFDYGQRVVTAEVVNASLPNTGYTSFETLEYGNWNYDNSMIVSDDYATGKQCFRFPSSGTWITKTLTLSKPYILSFWSKNGTPFVIINHTTTTLTPDKVIPHPNTGWTYYEYTVVGPCDLSVDNTSIHINNPQPFYLDELRVYPKDARMTTTSYDLKVGKITECDANNRIIYFEYDALGRLRIVRDENKNVIKTYEYNFKQ
jgi:hypothetical protein